MYIYSVEETEKLARTIGHLARPGDIFLLTGELGSGKTTLTKGIAKGLGIKKRIKSPTYTIVREYQEGRLPLYHMDIYRVENGTAELGLEEYFEGTGICVVEWGRMLKEDLPKDFLEITLEKKEKEEEREILFYPTGTKSKERMKEIIKENINEKNT